MTDLSRETRALLEAGTRALAPGPDARANIRAAVAARVAPAAPTNGSPTAATAASATARTWWTLLVVGLLVGAAVTWTLTRARANTSAESAKEPPPAAAPAPARTTYPTGPAPVAASPPGERGTGVGRGAGVSLADGARGGTADRPSRPRRDQAENAENAENAAPRDEAENAAPREDRGTAERPDPAASDTASDLDREVALLSAARRALRDGDPAAALQALQRHRRELQAPQMAREASLLRAEALCAAGRREAGRAELAAMDAASPGAPGTGPARAACAGD